MLYLQAKTQPLLSGLTRAAKQQLPFANALAVNKLAKRVIAVESAAIESTFDKPSTFTKNAFSQAPSFGGMYATKRLPVAMVVAKPIQGRYLAPSEEPKEPQALSPGKKRIRTPVAIGTNKGGNIPRGKLVELLARPDVFLGVVHGVNGIWQRPKRGTRRRGGYGTKGKLYANAGFTTTLKLLVAFTRPVHIKTNLHAADRAKATVDSHWSADLNAALAQAMETAK